MLQGSRAYKKTFIFCRDLETFKLTFKNRKSLNDNSGVRSHVLKLFIKIQQVVVTIETYIMQCKVHILQKKLPVQRKVILMAKAGIIFATCTGISAKFRLPRITEKIK